MDVLWIGPALALSLAATLFTGKAILSVFVHALERGRHDKPEL